jgi:hypothetical protein
VYATVSLFEAVDDTEPFAVLVLEARRITDVSRVHVHRPVDMLGPKYPGPWQDVAKALRPGDEMYLMPITSEPGSILLRRRGDAMTQYQLSLSEGGMWWLGR